MNAMRLLGLKWEPQFQIGTIGTITNRNNNMHSKDKEIEIKWNSGPQEGCQLEMKQVIFNSQPFLLVPLLQYESITFDFFISLRHMG